MILTGNAESEYAYYLPGHGEDTLRQVDDPRLLLWERVWMYPVRASSLDESDRPEDWEVVTRDKHGRFAPVIVWIECPENAAGAEPFLGVRYKP